MRGDWRIQDTEYKIQETGTGVEFINITAKWHKEIGISNESCAF